MATDIDHHQHDPLDSFVSEDGQFDSPNTTPPSFLTLPPELRLRVYTLLLTSTSIKVEAKYPGQEDAEHPWRMKPVSGLTVQLLQTCRLIHAEAHPLLYTHNTFDVSARDALPLLQTTIPTSIHLIRHLVFDWEHLQFFSWSLAKPLWQAATRGLEQISLASWRMRVLGGSSFLWRDVKSLERAIVQAAIEICEKHHRLRRVLQRGFARGGRWASQGRGNTSRVKWRIVGDGAPLEEGEVEVDLKGELALLTAGVDEGPRQTALDPV